MSEGEEFGGRLKRLREECGWSQSDLAEAAGVSLYTLQGWEQGRRVPLATVLPKLARALGVSADELLGLEPPGPRDGPPPKGKGRK
jgi:transcriptional regulator with XRE-family HTH domain